MTPAQGHLYLKLHRLIDDGELIDHIFASKALMGPLPTVTTAIAGPGQLRSITEDPREERGKPGSDHAAAVATFRLPG
jgi:hypothetical protein